MSKSEYHQAITQENDQLAIHHSGGLHGTAVATCSTVTPKYLGPSFPRETSALWSNQRLLSCPTTRLQLPTWEIRWGWGQNRFIERFSHKHMSVGREEGHDISSSPPSRTSNVLTDHLSRRGQILKTEWSLNQTIADRIFVPGADHLWICSPWGETRNWQCTSLLFRRRWRGKWTVLS